MAEFSRARTWSVIVRVVAALVTPLALIVVYVSAFSNQPPSPYGSVALIVSILIGLSFIVTIPSTIAGRIVVALVFTGLTGFALLIYLLMHTRCGADCF